MCQLAPGDAQPGIVISMLWVAHHWFPVVVKLQCGHVQVFTTPEGHDWITIATRALGSHITLSSVPIHRVYTSFFSNDCGFQAIGWIINAVFDPAFGSSEYQGKPVLPETAIAWRGLFESHLHATECSHRSVIPANLRFGGALGQDLMKQLQALLVDRGVPDTEAPARADLVVDKLGRQPVSRALRSKDPWREMKHLANQQIPKLQIVLPSELQEVIQAKALQGNPIGDKRKKVKNEKAHKKVVQLLPEDVSVPEGVFRDAISANLKQIPFASIGPEARGIVVLSAAKAFPYLSIRKPISKHGLGLLVIDYMEPTIQEVGEQIRFPARCERTGEPILLTAKLIQLGSSPITRAAPDTKTKVDEVCNQVIRTVTFKDEIQGINWTTFITKPVKHVISQLECLQDQEGKSPIIDIWDRQFLNDRLERTKPSESTIFVAAFRLEQQDVSQLMQVSGEKGHYIEPRSQDGRSPDSAYRVIWLAKHDKLAATLASQSTSQWSCIVRSGSRFGLRVRSEDAETVHCQHKPNTPFLDSDKVLSFHAGPFPHGANRAALQKLFAQWNWPARPSQPKNRSPNGLGVIWEVQATQKPQFEVYQLDHADVLITELPKRTPKMSQTVDVQGSAKTLAALSAPIQPDESADPWVQDDPWGNYATPVKSAKIAKPAIGTSEEQLDVLASKVANKLQTKPPLIPMDDGDTTMANDERIQDVEQRMQALESTMHQFHDRQQKHNTEVASQIGHIQQQVDQQSASLTQHLDAKMNEQLAHIERLLSARDPSKKSRME
eukprot:s2534_g4.t2